MIEKIIRLGRRFIETTFPENLDELVKEELGISIGATYGRYRLKNPIIIAPGQITRLTAQIIEIKKAGYSGCVLKSAVGEDEKGRCSMSSFRAPTGYTKSVYDPSDNEKKYPIIHWDGRLDTRTLPDYLQFAKESYRLAEKRFLLIASILCYLPPPYKDFEKEEWVYTTKKLFDAGYKAFEIDFCPQLSDESELIEKENILRWYRTIPSFIKSVSPEISVFPKLMNMDYGLDFQIEMGSESIKGGADGLVIGNRIFKKEFGCAHGGKELKERNLLQIKEIKKLFPDIHISGTGGIYTGKDILDYLEAGAENIQILSLLMGRTSMEFTKKGTKFEKVLHKLLFDPLDGLLASMIKSSGDKR
jgi:hypothetical protein